MSVRTSATFSSWGGMDKLKLTHPELSDKNHLDDRLLGDDPSQEVLQGRLNFSPRLKAIRT